MMGSCMRALMVGIGVMDDTGECVALHFADTLWYALHPRAVGARDMFMLMQGPWQVAGDDAAGCDGQSEFPSSVGELKLRWVWCEVRVVWVRVED